MKDMQVLSDEQRMDEDLIHGLLDVNHMMRMLYEGKASQSRTLIIIYGEGKTGVSQKKLIEQLNIKPGSASEILSKLEKAGLIVRRQSKTDRRSVDIDLTDEGEKFAIEAIEKRRKRHREMLACLTKEEKETFLSFLDKLTDDWNTRFPIFESNQIKEKLHRKPDQRKGE